MTGGQVLGGASMDGRAEPASLTKLTTAYPVSEAVYNGKLKCDQMITPAGIICAAKTDESCMFLKAGRPASVREMTQDLIIQPGNGATPVLAEAVGGVEANFVTLTDRGAKRPGMKNTHFINAADPPDLNHYSTVCDLSILTATLIKDFPQNYEFYSQKESTYNNIK